MTKKSRNLGQQQIRKEEIPNLEITQILYYYRIWGWTDCNRESSERGRGRIDILIGPINYACNLNFTMQLFRLYIIFLESLVTNLTEMHTVLEIRNVVLYNVM